MYGIVTVIMLPGDRASGFVGGRIRPDSGPEIVFDAVDFVNGPLHAGIRGRRVRFEVTAGKATRVRLAD